MAGSFQVLSSYSTIQVLKANVVVPVEYVNCETFPSGIGFSYAVPKEVWERNRGGDALGLIADELENMVVNYHVVDGDAAQSLDASSLLADAVALVVEYDRPSSGLPPLQGEVNISIGDVLLEASDPEIYNASGKPTPQAQVQAEYQRLQALAAG
jgi:hypothetical protein